MTPSVSSLLEFDDQRQKTGIRGHAQKRQSDHDVSARPELLPMLSIGSDLGEELLVPLLTAINAGAQYPQTVDGEERSDAVELRGEDLEHDQGKGEL